MSAPLHYGVIGVGPVGTTLATELAAGGHEVSVLAVIPQRLKEIREAPVTLTGELKAKAQLKNLYKDLPSFLAAKPDVILIATKNSDSPELLKDIKKIGIGPKTVLVSAQNGFDVENQIVELFGSDRALRMVLNMGCSFVNPHEIKLNFCFTNYLSLRKDVNPEITTQIVKDFNSSGYPVVAREDYRQEVYKKVILNSSLGSVCALTNMTMQAVMNKPDLLRMVKQIVREAIAVGQAEGFPIPDSFLDEAMKYFSKGGDHKPSILLDLEAGRKTENEYLCGKIFEYAQKHSVEVAVTQTLYYLLKNKERAAIAEAKKGALK